jgi:hypothetical protein
MKKKRRSKSTCKTTIAYIYKLYSDYISGLWNLSFADNSYTKTCIIIYILTRCTWTMDTANWYGLHEELFEPQGG